MNERELFEEWVNANWPHSVSLGMNIDGRYRYNHANALFELWKQLRKERKRNVIRIAFFVAVILQAFVVIALVWGCA